MRALDQASAAALQRLVPQVVVRRSQRPDLRALRRPGRRVLWWFDVRVIDGTVNGIGDLTQSTGRGIRHIQTGRVQNYALGIAAGLIVMAVSYIFIAR